MSGSQDPPTKNSRLESKQFQNPVGAAQAGLSQEIFAAWVGPVLRTKMPANPFQLLNAT